MFVSAIALLQLVWRWYEAPQNLLRLRRADAAYEGRRWPGIPAISGSTVARRRPGGGPAAVRRRPGCGPATARRRHGGCPAGARRRSGPAAPVPGCAAARGPLTRRPLRAAGKALNGARSGRAAQRAGPSAGGGGLRVRHGAPRAARRFEGRQSRARSESPNACHAGRRVPPSLWRGRASTSCNTGCRALYTTTAALCTIAA